LLTRSSSLLIDVLTELPDRITWPNDLTELLESRWV